MVVYSDTFAGSGALGVTEVGGLAWEAISGTWSRSGGRAVASENGNNNPPPIAVVDLGVGQADLSVAVSGTGGDAIYTRVVDVNNWVRARLRQYQTSNTSYWTEYEYNDNVVEYEYRMNQSHDSTMGTHTGNTSGSASPSTSTAFAWSSTGNPWSPGDGTYTSHSHSGGGSHVHEYKYTSSTATGASRTVSQGTYWATSPRDGNDTATGNSRQQSSTSYFQNYRVILEKCVDGVITQLGIYTANSSTSSLRLRADGSNLQVYVNGTSRISASDATHSSATKHGIGKGTSEYQGSALDNFSIEPLIPPTPTITAPSNNSTITTGTPTLQTSAASWGGALTKVEYQIASDSGFTADLKTLVEPNEAYRASGSYGLKVTEANLLSQQGWYIRARQVSESGLAGNWTAANFFTVAHSPGAIDLAPSGGKGVVVGATNRLSWKFTDTSETDSQTAYHVIIERNDNSAVVLDTGKVTSADQFYDFTVDPALKDVQLRFRVKVWDEEDKPSSWTNYALFIPTDAPVLTILEPLDGGNVGTSRPFIRWTFAASGGRSQASHRITVTLLGAGTSIYDSGDISGSATSHTVAEPVIQNAKTYEIRVYATDSLGITVVAVTTVSAVYEEPDVVEFSVDDSYYESSGYVRLTWQAENDPTFRKWRVYRREVGKQAWTLLTEINQLTVTEYRDWLVPSMTNYDYYVVQVVERFNEEVESVVGATVRLNLGSGGYWLIDPINPNNNLRLHNVTTEDYTDMNEQAEYLIVGRGRHVDEGESIGKSGTMGVQLRDTLGSTARYKKQTLEALRKKKIPVYLRNPFGDLDYIALGDIQVTRVSGVGSSEFVDVSVPYLQVF